MVVKKTKNKDLAAQEQQGQWQQTSITSFMAPTNSTGKTEGKSLAADPAKERVKVFTGERLKELGEQKKVTHSSTQPRDGFTKNCPERFYQKLSH